MLGAIALMLAVQLLFAAWHAPLAGIAALLVGFFAAFNVLEALLPSLVSRIAPEHARGAALGAYNTTQTLGLFVGGLAGGALAGHFGAAAVYMLGATAMLAWLAVAGTMGPLPAIGGDSAITRPGVNADAGAALDHKRV
jgi:MFS family permease